MDTALPDDFTTTVTEFYRLCERFDVHPRYADSTAGLYYAYTTKMNVTQSSRMVKAACFFFASLLDGERILEAGDVMYYSGADGEAIFNDTLAHIATTLEGELITMTPAHYLRQYELRGELPSGTWEAVRELMHSRRAFSYSPAYLADVVITSRRHHIPFEWPVMEENTITGNTELATVDTADRGTVIIGEGLYGKVTSVKGFAYKESDLLCSIMMELAVMRRCQHPNVLSVLGFGYKREENEEAEMMITAVLRLPLAVSNLNEHLTTKLHHQQWVRELFAGLAHLHSRGILHADIKPANLLIMEDGRLVIADFGVSVAHVTPGDHTTLYDSEQSALPYRDVNLIPLPSDSRNAPLGFELDVWAAGMVLVALERGTNIDDTYTSIAKVVREQQDIVLREAYGKPYDELLSMEFYNAITRHLIDTQAAEKAWRQYLLDEIVSGNTTRGWKNRHYAAVVQSIFVVSASLRPSAAEVLSVL